MSNSLTLPPTPASYLLSVSLPLLILCETKPFRAGHAVSKLLSSTAFVSGPLVRIWNNPPQPPFSSSYCVLITAGLLFSVLGDFFLIPSSEEYYGPNLDKSRSSGTSSSRSSNRAKQEKEQEEKKKKISISFQLGMVAFAAAHVAYILAFVQDTTQEPLSRATFTSTFVATMILAKLLGVIPYSPTGGSSSNLLSLSIPADMRLLVTAYALIISSMLAVAASTTPSAASQWPYQRFLGAAMFVVSDIFVAKDAFGGSKLRKDGGRQPNHWLRNALGFGLYFGAQMVIAGTVEGK